MAKSAKFQMTIHIDYDREENKILFLMASQTKMIRTLADDFSNIKSKNSLRAFFLNLDKVRQTARG